MPHFAAWRRWLKHPGMSEELTQELLSIQDDQAAIRDRFAGGLRFGAAGIRGLMGAGTTRVNDYTVDRVGRGLAAWLLKKEDLPSCVIGYDSRRNSRRFAGRLAAALAARGVRVHLFEELTPVPLLSFAVRYLRCDAGVMITASHNGPEYNGLKMYDATGCALLEDAALSLCALVEAEQELCTRFPDEEQLTEKRLIRPVSREVREAYQDAVLKLSILTPPAPLKVVYSPLHGAGLRSVRQVLLARPNIEVQLVAAQEHPDGAFPTVASPNPEDPAAMAMAAAQMLAQGADICLATDADCDRLGVGVRVKDDARMLSGNELAVLLLHFICEGLTNEGNMPEGAIAVKTVVTTPMAENIARHYNVRMVEVLTGFRYIGEVINRLDREGEAQRFILGMEESHGYLSGTHVREKDAVNAAMLVCEMASYYKSVNSNLLEAHEALQRRFGYYEADTQLIELAGEEGAQRLKRLMAAFRTMDTVAGFHVESLVDYMKDDTGLPAADVLEYRLEGDRHLLVRPSGTEPLLKLYLTVKGDSQEQARESLKAFTAEVMAAADAIG